MSNYPLFYRLLANHLVANITNMFVWFALTFWVFIETQSVLVTSWIAGIFAILSLFGGFIFGPIVDHERKKTAMLHSSIISLIFFTLASIFYYTVGPEAFIDTTSYELWLFVTLVLIGTVAGNLRTIALSTTVTMLFTENRDKANGLVGATQGITFAFTSVLSGLAIGFLGMEFSLYASVVATVLVLLHLLFFISLPEPSIVHLEESAKPKKVDLRGTMLVVLAIPGLLGLIFFNTVNNFLGGVFMALMDAYGLSLVSVQTWGFMWGVMSIAMIGGSIYVTKYGVGTSPLRRIMVLNIVMWGSCMLFPIQASILFLAVGMFIWMLLSPMIEAAEQTVMQAIVPFERQGRVFGLAQSIESMASPITTFFIGPIAQLIFIPFMTTGAGVVLIGDWFGTGIDRGIALVFILAGFLGVIATLFAWYSKSFKKLSEHYTEL